jgi:hypothetical protein
MRFERLFVGLYETGPLAFGRVGFFDVMDRPPRARRPGAGSLLGFEALIEEIVKTYDARNSPTFEWADAEPEIMTEPPVDSEASGDEEEA